MRKWAGHLSELPRRLAVGSGSFPEIPNNQMTATPTQNAISDGTVVDDQDADHGNQPQHDNKTIND